MSRKAMKKTLEQLAEDVMDKVEKYGKVRTELENDPTNPTKILNFVWVANVTLSSFLLYAQALENAYSEFAEDFDKKLEKMEKAIQTMDKSVEKKEGSKGKPFYVK